MATNWLRMRKTAEYKASKTDTALYHMSPHRLDAVENNGVFGGVFCTPYVPYITPEGLILHEVRINSVEILRQSYWVRDRQAERDILRDELPHVTEEELDAILNVVREDASIFDIALPRESALSALRAFDMIEAEWKRMRLRGVIAKKYGYKAVAIENKDGLAHTSGSRAGYIVLPGAKISAKCGQ